MTVDELWQTRAAAWELAALSLRYPGSELAGAAAGGEWDEAAGEILAALGLPAEVPAAAWASAARAPMRSCAPCDPRPRACSSGRPGQPARPTRACGPQRPTGCSRFCS